MSLCAVCSSPFEQTGRGRPALSCIACRPKYKQWCRARWRTGNPEKQRRTARQQRASALRHQYGLSLEAWDAMLIAQTGRCGICTAAMQHPHVDHCHETDRVRGLLCQKCNTGLGKLGDTVAGLQRALAYLTKES